MSDPWKRLPTDPADLGKMSPIASPNPLILQEAYKKHATELANIEDRQHKHALLMLGIFSAGATLIASGRIDISCALAVALTIFSIAVVVPSIWYNCELHCLRGATRELLVRCEIALGFHKEGHFLQGEKKLYADNDIAYGEKGNWLRNWCIVTVAAVCAAFIGVVWAVYTHPPKAPVPPALAVTCASSPSNSPSR
jgi:hypothetical protein